MTIVRDDRHPARPPAPRAAEIELSIEIFPPKTEVATARLWQNIDLFAASGPRFISVTSGAGGTGEEDTFPLVRKVQEQCGVPVAAHLTCANASCRDIDELAQLYWHAGIRRLVALRGDPPKEGGPYRPRPDGYAYAADLVAALRRVAPFEISVGCYPEVHPEAASAAADLDNLARKVDAGACRMITQYCFDTDAMLRLRDAVAARGLEAEFVAGIMPIHSFAQVRRFSSACGAGIPAWLEALFDGVPESSQMHAIVAANVAVEQCRRLTAEGLNRFHVYALNRAELPLALVRLLGAASPALPAAA